MEDLTSISTFGWFQEPVVASNLTAMSIFGWYNGDGALVLDRDIFNIILNIQNLLHLDIER